MDDEDRRVSEGRRATDGRLEALGEVRTSMDGVRAAVETLTAVIGSMATKEDVALAEKRQEKRTLRVAIGTGVAFILLVMPIVGQAYTLDKVEDVAVENQDQGQLLLECTTPGNPNSIDPEDRVHECYDEGRARSAATVAAINLAVLDAATCAVTVDAPDIPKCYADRIETRTGARPDLEP